MDWTLDRVAEVISRVSGAYPDGNAVGIVTVAVAVGMTAEQIEGQVQKRDDINAALREWGSMEPSVAQKLVLEVKSYPGACFVSNERMMDALQERILEEKEKFLAGRGVK